MCFSFFFLFLGDEDSDDDDKDETKTEPKTETETETQKEKEKEKIGNESQKVSNAVKAIENIKKSKSKEKGTRKEREKEKISQKEEIIDREESKDNYSQKSGKSQKTLTSDKSEKLKISKSRTVTPGDLGSILATYRSTASGNGNGRHRMNHDKIVLKKVKAPPTVISVLGYSSFEPYHGPQRYVRLDIQKFHMIFESTSSIN